MFYEHPYGTDRYIVVSLLLTNVLLPVALYKSICLIQKHLLSALKLNVGAKLAQGRSTWDDGEGGPGRVLFSERGQEVGGPQLMRLNDVSLIRHNAQLKTVTQYRSTRSHAHAGPPRPDTGSRLRLGLAQSPYRNPFKVHSVTQWINYLAIDDYWVGGYGW